MPILFNNYTTKIIIKKYTYKCSIALFILLNYFNKKKYNRLIFLKSIYVNVYLFPASINKINKNQNY